MRRTICITAAAAAVTLAVPAAANAAPVQVRQSPATAMVSSGLAFPVLWRADVAVHTRAPGVVGISVPTDPSTCMTNGYSTLARVDWVNRSTGARGGVTVKPCSNFADPTPVVADARTGAGNITFTTKLLRPMSTPGGGSFTVR